jgi:hypothetical protein
MTSSSMRKKSHADASDENQQKEKKNIAIKITKA